MARKFRQITEEKHQWVGGVCAGMAYWLGAPVWLVRLVWFLMALISIGTLPYIILWIFLPQWKETPEDFEEITGD